MLQTHTVNERFRLYRDTGVELTCKGDTSCLASSTRWWDTCGIRATSLEASMDNALLDAIAAAADTRLAFSNGWRHGRCDP